MTGLQGTPSREAILQCNDLQTTLPQEHAVLLMKVELQILL